jgi:outer membrane protein
MAFTGDRDHARIHFHLGKRIGGASFALALLLSGHPAGAETLKEALAAAYLTSSQLQAQRFALRATDENAARARSGFRPNVSASAEYSARDNSVEFGSSSGTSGIDPSFFGAGKSYPKSYSVTLTQPVFRGFRTINAVRGAEAGIEAGREQLRSVEQQVLLAAVQAYEDVVRDLAMVRLRENNVKVLSEQLRAVENRFKVGEVTKTDVAQSTASLSGGKSDLIMARANLQVSRANYVRVIGHAPRHVRDGHPISRLLPRSVEKALKVGEGEHPDIIAAIYQERAQDHVIEQARGELLPQVNVQASYNKTFNPQPGMDTQETTIVGAKVSVPLYQSGEVGARIRQNVELRSQLRRQIDVMRLQVRSNVSSAWSQLAAVKGQIVSYKAQAEATRIALEGVRQEEKVGQRTVLDTLNAQQAHLSSQVQLETAKHDHVVASYSLLSAIGRLSAASLRLPVATYDPTAHYNKVKNKFMDWDTHVERGDEPTVGSVSRPVKGRDHPNGPAY